MHRNTTGDTYFTIKGVAPYLKQNGEAAEDYRLFVNESGNMTFGRINTEEELVEYTTRFGVKAKSTARPGDDFLLRFGIAGDICAPAVADEGDFIACYDKKLLWRANLYVDETKNETDTPTGNMDWNNVHLWNSAENVWQGNGNGGQITIKPWTRYNFPANTPVYNAVAYSHACYDSPRDFNDDLVDQRNAVRAWYSNENPYWKIDDDKDGNPDNINPHQERGFGKSKEWDSTLAPGGVWGMAESNASVNYRFGIPLNDEDGHYDPLNIQVGGNNVYYPYTPNFTSKKLNETPDGYEYIHTSYSSGIDCVTIIQRSAGYAGNQYYQITDLAEKRQKWGQTWAPLESVGSIESACWPISNGSLLIPGDILVLHRKNGGHCGIVQRILYGNDRSVGASQVLILDSSGVVMRVRLETSWYQMISDRNIITWSIGRLKHQ